MNELESLFRWAFYYDYGTTPERVLRNARYRMEAAMNELHDGAMVNLYSRVSECSPQQISRSHFVLSINEFLRKYKQNIIDESEAKGIDGRAVAAAITWEFKENLKGRYSDFVQVLKPGKISGIGWGSMHAQEALDLTQEKKSLAEIACIRMDAVSLIPLVVKFMKNCIDTYFKTSGGIFIGDDPAVIAFFYNSGLGKVQESAKKRKRELDKMNLTPTTIKLNVTVNPMAKWVKANLHDFEGFKTAPKLPANVRTIAVSN